MADIQGEEKNSLDYGKMEGSVSSGAEQVHAHQESPLGGTGISDTLVREETVETEADNADALAKVREELLLDVGGTKITPPHEPTIHPGDLLASSNISTNEVSSQVGTPQENPRLFRRVITNIQGSTASWIYDYLGDKTPVSIRNHVPVYRAVSKQHAGFGNQSGMSEWTIGAGAKEHAKRWVENHTYNPHDESTAYLRDGEEYVSVQSSLGDLERHGEATATHYGEYGSGRKKIVVQHASPDTPIRHKIIKSNKDQ